MKEPAARYRDPDALLVLPLAPTALERYVEEQAGPDGQAHGAGRKSGCGHQPTAAPRGNAPRSYIAKPFWRRSPEGPVPGGHGEAPWRGCNTGRSLIQEDTEELPVGGSVQEGMGVPGGGSVR